SLVGDLCLPPRLNLALQRLEVPLNPVHAYRERVNQIEALGVLGQDRREHVWDNVSKFPRVLTSPKADFWPAQNGYLPHHGQHRNSLWASGRPKASAFASCSSRR